MINTIYLDHEFNFLLLESTQEENRESTTKIYLNIKTDATTGQRLEISVAGGAVVTENIASDRVVKFELSPEYWADDGATEITPKNDDITGATITINFPKTFTTSAALNYISDTEFDIQAQNEAFAESGSSGSGSSGSGGAAFDFVETIRNIGFRLLDEPSNVNAFFDEVAEEVQIKWTDPADIATNEPAPATWAGTVVVRKEGSAPRHRWDGVEIIDSTTRDEYSATALVDNTVEINKSYYYGIFPYDTKGDYRFTKVVSLFAQELEEPTFDYLYDGSKPSAEQFPAGLAYDLGNFYNTGYSNTILPEIENDHIHFNQAEACGTSMIFLGRLTPCSTLKVQVKKISDAFPYSGLNIFGGINKDGYVSNPPNYDNETIYNIETGSRPYSFALTIDPRDISFSEITTISIPLPASPKGMYVAIAAYLNCNIYKVWGE